MRIFIGVLTPWSFLEVIGHVDDDALEAVGTAAVEQGSLDQQGGLVVQQLLPPPGRDEFRQHHCRQCAIVMLAVIFIQVIEQRADDRAVG